MWLAEWDGKLDVVALEATTGWRWVARVLQARGIEVRLTDPVRRVRCRATASGRRPTVSTRAGW